MGLFRSIGNGFSKAYHWLIQDEEKLNSDESRDNAWLMDDDDEEGNRKKESRDDYEVWEEVDNFRMNFFIGGWATKKLKRVGDGKLIKEREEMAKKRAEAEGREYKSALQRDLEAAAKRREEKERLKEEKRRQKEARKQSN